jgi:hypothetical protein
MEQIFKTFDIWTVATGVERETASFSALYKFLFLVDLWYRIIHCK